MVEAKVGNGFGTCAAAAPAAGTAGTTAGTVTADAGTTELTDEQRNKL